jgi:hypothetical protein
VVVVLGLTRRVAGDEVIPFCGTPSDHIRFQGAVPVRDALIVVEPPAQTEAVPRTVAAGRLRGVMVADPLEVPVQNASVIVATQ